MARRLALVEEDYLQRLKDKSSGEALESSKEFKSDNTQSSNDPEAGVKIYGIPEKKDEYQTLIDLLPGRLQTKAKLLLHYLRDVPVDGQGRVIYPDGVNGSYLIDLIRYFVSPKSMSPAKPIDATTFTEVMRANGVPTSALGAGRSLIASIEPHVEKPRRKRIHWLKP
jgi:hypothetical protein